MPEDRQLVTRLLQLWSGGDKEALDAMLPQVYEKLRKVTSRCLRDERPDRTQRATALVNEAYLRMVDAKVDWQDRVHFFAIAARLLRRILVNHAKARNSQRRGLGFDKIPLDEAVLVSPGASSEVIELEHALTRLAARDLRKSEIVELLFFGGLTYDETATALSISAATVHRELTMAKAWLHRELAQKPA